METGRKKFHLCDLFPLIQGLTPPVDVTGLALGCLAGGRVGEMPTRQQPLDYSGSHRETSKTGWLK